MAISILEGLNNVMVVSAALMSATGLAVVVILIIGQWRMM